MAEEREYTRSDLDRKGRREGLIGLGFGAVGALTAAMVVGNAVHSKDITVRLPKPLSDVDGADLESPEHIVRILNNSREKGEMVFSLDGSPDQKLFEFTANVQGKEMELSWTVADCKELGKVLGDLKAAAARSDIPLPASSIGETIKRRRTEAWQGR